MSTTTQEELANLIKTVTDGINSATEFTLQHAPDVVQEILLWNTVTSAVFFVVGVLMAIGVGIKLKGFIISNFSNDDDYLDSISLIVLVFGGSTSLIMICENLDWLQIMIAPKLYLIEYASKLVN